MYTYFSPPSTHLKELNKIDTHLFHCSFHTPHCKNRTEKTIKIKCRQKSVNMHYLLTRKNQKCKDQTSKKGKPVHQMSSFSSCIFHNSMIYIYIYLLVFIFISLLSYLSIEQSCNKVGKE